MVGGKREDELDWKQKLTVNSFAAGGWLGLIVGHSTLEFGFMLFI
jgi:hypothetical protein